MFYSLKEDYCKLLNTRLYRLGRVYRVPDNPVCTTFQLSLRCSWTIDQGELKFLMFWQGSSSTADCNNPSSRRVTHLIEYRQKVQILISKTISDIYESFLGINTTNLSRCPYCITPFAKFTQHAMIKLQSFGFLCFFFEKSDL